MRVNRQDLEAHLRVLKSDTSGMGAIFFEAVVGLLETHLENTKVKLVTATEDQFQNLQGQAQACVDLLNKLRSKSRDQ